MQWPKYTLSAMATVLASLISNPLFAQGAGNFPSKPVTIVLPYSPGANADAEARMYQDGLNSQLKQPTLIDYKPGGSGVIANRYVAKAVPDGHTLAFVNSSSAILPALRRDLGYDLVRDFVPVVLTTENITVLLVTPSLPVQTFQEYIAYAKARPGEVTWSTVGPGGGFHVAGEWLASATGINLSMIHYKGGAAAELDLIAGRIHSTPKQLPPSLPLIRSGKARVIAILTKDQTPLLPGVRTVAQMGAPDFAYSSWIGLLAPAGTPVEIVNKLNAEVVKALKSPKAMKVWEAQGSIVVGATPEAFRRILAADLARWDKLVREKNIKED